MTKNFPGIFFWDSNQGKNKPATLNRSQNFFPKFYLENRCHPYVSKSGGRGRGLHRGGVSPTIYP